MKQHDNSTIQPKRNIKIKCQKTFQILKNLKNYKTTKISPSTHPNEHHNTYKLILHISSNHDIFNSQRQDETSTPDTHPHHTNIQHHQLYRKRGHCKFAMYINLSWWWSASLSWTHKESNILCSSLFYSFQNLSTQVPTSHKQEPQTPNFKHLKELTLFYKTNVKNVIKSIKS